MKKIIALLFVEVGFYFILNIIFNFKMLKFFTHVSEDKHPFFL